MRRRKLETSLELLGEALEIRVKLFGDENAEPPHPRVADAFANLGLLFRLAGRPADALPNLLKALDMQMRIHRTRDCDAVQVRRKLGDSLPHRRTPGRKRKDRHSAGECCAVYVQDVVLGLGCLQHQGGRLREALDAYTEVYRHRSRTLGVSHPDTETVAQLLKRVKMHSETKGQQPED